MSRPSRTEAEEAVRTLLRWLGDDPDREGLRATPGRVVKAYEEWFAGYKDDPVEYLRRTFYEVDGYDECVARERVRDIEETVTRVLHVSRRHGIPPHEAADRIAEERISEMRRAKGV